MNATLPTNDKLLPVYPWCRADGRQPADDQAEIAAVAKQLRPLVDRYDDLTAAHLGVALDRSVRYAPEPGAIITEAVAAKLLADALAVHSRIRGMQDAGYKRDELVVARRVKALVGAVQSMIAPPSEESALNARASLRYAAGL